MSKAEDMVRIRHMRDAAVEAYKAVEHLQREDLIENTLITLGIVKCFEIIGEAASEMSDEFKTDHPEFPWRVMKGMRNRLVHAYFDIDIDIVWETTQLKLPLLIEQTQAVLKSNNP